MAATDGLVWAFSIASLNLLRDQLGFAKAFAPHLWVIVGVAIGLQALLGLATPLYRATWRVGSFEELLWLAPIVVAVGGVIGVVSLTPRHHVVPATAVVGGTALALVGTAGLRVGWRLNWERQRRPLDLGERAIIFGAGEAGVQLIEVLLADPSSGYLPVALLDDDPFKRNLRLRLLKVSGTRRDLASVAARLRADSVIIAIPSAGSGLVREITELATEAGLKVRVLPPVSQMLTSSLHADDVRPVTPADMLGRRVIRTDVESIAGYLTDRRVLVTGAGGSIGSELCRQIHRHNPSRLVMLDRDESALHQVQLSLEGRALLDGRHIALCDIRDIEAVDEVFAEHRPEVVFHAAALKHLPLLELWPAEAVKTNIVATQNVLDVAQAYSVDRFVNISTDKAVNPTSILGYSKRIGERLTAHAAASTGAAYLSVRFGNVLGSRGSVLPTFQAQIDAGGPLTVTHPEVTRYFMTVEEAVELVIQAGAIGLGGEVLVLDMGEPVSIAKVAAAMAATARPPVEIVYTGLRPGEKLEEELLADGEEVRRRVHPMIAHVCAQPLPPTTLADIDATKGTDEIRNRLERLCSWDIAEMVDLEAEFIDVRDHSVADAAEI
jgi:FlaA1/EpsC-like NDP-sugar epimerase